MWNRALQIASKGIDHSDTMAASGYSRSSIPRTFRQRAAVAE